MTQRPGSVNRRARRTGDAASRAAWALLAVVCAGGCFRPTRDAPVDPAFTWTDYQGSPARDAFVEMRVPERAPEILWNVNTGRGLDAPPVALGPVILAATTNRMVMALDAESGDIYWEHRKNGPFQSPPLSDGDRVYVATADTRGRIYGLRLVDGRERWEKTYPGVSSPMLLSGDRLFVAHEPGVVTALLPRNGDQVWQAGLGAPTAGGLVRIDDRLLVATIRDTLYAVSVEDGQVLERHPLDARVSAPPAVAGGILYLPHVSGHVTALDAATLEERWRAHVEAPVLAAPGVSGDRVFALASSGSVWSIDARGRPRRLADLGAAATGALTVTSNALLVGLLDGRLVAVSPEDGSELWTVDLGDSVQTPPAVQDGTIYVPLRRGRVVRLR